MYRQLMDAVAGRIRSGALPSGTKLPTVRELAGREGVARGTVKKAYDELEREGLVRQIQGRGTFVNCAGPAGRKEQAMQDIDELLDRLESMEFSMTDINIFLNLKLRERAARREKVKVAVVECNPEVLTQLTNQLRQIRDIDFYSCLLEQLRAYPYQIAGETDLIITTVEHAAEVEKMTEQGKKIAKVVLRLDPHCVAKIMKLDADSAVGILCRSLRFGRLLWDFCRSYAGELRVSPPVELSAGLDCGSFLAGKDAVLLPDGYEKHFPNEILEQLREYGKTRLLLPCAYQIDGGSFLYASERIESLRNGKRLT